jgi:hypothetical protein
MYLTGKIPLALFTENGAFVFMHGRAHGDIHMQTPHILFFFFLLIGKHTIYIVGDDEKSDFPDARKRVASKWNHEWQC